MSSHVRLRVFSMRDGFSVSSITNSIRPINVRYYWANAPIKVFAAIDLHFEGSNKIGQDSVPIGSSYANVQMAQVGKYKAQIVFMKGPIRLNDAKKKEANQNHTVSSQSRSYYHFWGMLSRVLPVFVVCALSKRCKHEISEPHKIRRSS